MLHGSIVALVTPMNGQGEIDFAALSRLIDFHLKNHTDALVIAGTTGESASLTSREFSALLEAAVSHAEGRIPIIAGTGTASTAESIKKTQLADEMGADAALLVTPYYVRPMQSGLEAHFLAVADASRIPLILYNVPSRTSVDMLPDTVVALSAHESVIAIKEALPDMSRIAELVERCGPEFTVLSGDDPSCLDAMKNGAKGVISVAANTDPGRFSTMAAHAASGEWAAAEALDAELSELYKLLGAETNPIPVKWSVHELGLIGPHIRLPLLPPEEPVRAAIRCWLESAGKRDSLYD